MKFQMVIRATNGDWQYAVSIQFDIGQLKVLSSIGVFGGTEVLLRPRLCKTDLTVKE